MSNRLSTAQLPFDLEASIPALRGTARRCVRLHPRRSAPGLGTSKLGGAFLWPLGEAWPVCQEHGPLEGVVQLLRQDFPELPFPAGTDVMQLLGCPLRYVDCQGGGEPAYRLVWRSEASMGTAQRARPETQTQIQPTIQPPYDEWRPLRECRLSPERLIDYPDYWALGDAARAAVSMWRPPSEMQTKEWAGAETGVDEPVDFAAWLRPFGVGAEALDELTSVMKGMSSSPGADVYRGAIGAVPGTKLLGHPAWMQGPEDADETRCGCGRPMELLLQFDSTEFGLDSPLRWCPLEDRESHRRYAGDPWEEEIRCPHGAMIGDAGRLYVFACVSCPERPARVVAQCC